MNGYITDNFPEEYYSDSSESKSCCDNEEIQAELISFYDRETTSNSSYKEQMEECCSSHCWSEDSSYSLFCESVNINPSDQQKDESFSILCKDKSIYQDEEQCCSIDEEKSSSFLKKDESINKYEYSEKQEESDKVCCKYCEKVVDKSECFLKKDDNEMICICCAIKKRISKDFLKDWEEFHKKHDYPRLKKCSRCGKFKNKNRFKTRTKYCSYCSLKKKLSYAQKNSSI